MTAATATSATVHDLARAPCTRGRWRCWDACIQNMRMMDLNICELPDIELLNLLLAI